MFSETQESAPTWELLFSTPLLFWPLSEYVRFLGLKYLKWVECKERGGGLERKETPQDSVSVTCWKETLSRTPSSLTLFSINPSCLRGRIQPFLCGTINCLRFPYASPVLALKASFLTKWDGWLPQAWTLACQFLMWTFQSFRRNVNVLELSVSQGHPDLLCEYL